MFVPILAIRAGASLGALLRWVLGAQPNALLPTLPAIHEFIERELKVAAARMLLDSSSPDATKLDAFLKETVRKNEAEQDEHA